MKEPQPRAIRLVEDRWSTVRHIVEAVAIVTAGLWAFYTFYYQEKIKPAHEPPALSPAITVSRLGRDARREILDISVSYHNTGKTQIDIAADAVNVWGIRYSGRDTVRHDDSGGWQLYRDTMAEVSRRLIASDVKLLQAASGGRSGYRNIIEPGATTTVSSVIAVPRGRYDLIRAEIIAVPVKLDQTGVHIDLVPEPGGGTHLRPHPGQAVEDDNDTDFALTP